MKYADFGSISHGTLRSQDLVDVFTSELEWQISQQTREPWNAKTLDWVQDILDTANEECYDAEGNHVEDFETLDYYACEALPDALDAFAPPYGYFGTHEGDGSDFGYWVSWDAIQMAEHDGDIKRIAAGDPFPTKEAECLEVTDHGNASLYARNEAGDWKEVWAVV